jgi:hypothetical protein
MKKLLSLFLTSRTEAILGRSTVDNHFVLRYVFFWSFKNWAPLIFHKYYSIYQEGLNHIEF